MDGRRQIICISRGTYSGGKSLAESLARKLGCTCLSREELADSVARSGIALGKLEIAVQRRRPLNDWLHIEKERFKAFVTSTLADHALRGSLVYHGNHAHIQLAGVSCVMRVRVIMDPEMRVAATMQRLGLPREKAKRYNDEVDEDRRRWVRTLYNVSLEDPAHYDLVLNLSHLNVDNAAAAIANIAQLPEFQASPADLRTLTDLSLGARCRLAVAEDPRTSPADIKVTTASGRVVTSYLPRQQSLAAILPEVISKVHGVQQVVCTLASTRLMWIQERFDPAGETFKQILDISSRWDASVDLVQLVDSVPENSHQEVVSQGDTPNPAAENIRDSSPHGGILDEASPLDTPLGDEGVANTISSLITSGRAGSCRRVGTGVKDLLGILDASASYSLVVVGETFLGKAEPVRKRMTRDLVSYLAHKLRVPVVGIDDLKERYVFGPKQWLHLLLYGASSALLFALVFSYQPEVLDFLSKDGGFHRVLSTACLVLFVPLFAYLFGNFSRCILRAFGFE